MGSHLLVHGRPDILLKARIAHLHLASTKSWSLAVGRVTVMRMPDAPPPRPWMSETEVEGQARPKPDERQSGVRVRSLFRRARAPGAGGGETPPLRAATPGGEF